MILVCDNGRGGQARLECLRCLMSDCTQLIPATSSGGKLSSKGHTYLCSREKDSGLDMYIYTSIISCQYVYTCKNKNHTQTDLPCHACKVALGRIQERTGFLICLQRLGWDQKMSALRGIVALASEKI